MNKFLLMTLLVLLFGSLRVASACSCGSYPAVCESYSEAKAVFIGTVLTVENTLPKKDEESLISQRAWVRVDKVFKGEVAGEVPFRSYGTSCDVTYKDGQQWLFYAYFDEKEKTWRIRECDRSTLLEGANDDLSYLNGLPKSAQTTRISGLVEHFENDPEKGFSLVKHIIGAKVRISGTRNYEVFTDSNGGFEIYGAPPGFYEMKPEIPLGLKLRFPMFFGPRVVVAPPGDGEGVKLRLKLKEKSCISMEFVLSADNAISGKVIGADGKPMPRVCLQLVPANAPQHRPGRTSFVFDCTKADGTYTLDQIPPGHYLIVANHQSKISSDEPFPAVYYPGTFDRKKATAITMALGDRRTDYNLHIPSQSTTHILSGVLLFADGKPVPDGFVQFDGVDVPAGFKGETHTSVDSQGRFQLPVLAGLKGSLRGYIHSYQGEYVNCPKLDQILKKGGGRVLDISSERLPIEVNSDKPNLELKLPFPFCLKAKER